MVAWKQSIKRLIDCYALKVKEELCYISLNFREELLNSRIAGGRFLNASAVDPFGHPLKRQFVLPDFQRVMRGFVKEIDSPPLESEQVIRLKDSKFFKES